MPCGAKEAGGVYLPAPTCLCAGTDRQRLRQAGRPRHPQESPFYRLVERFYPEFEAVYEERYQERRCSREVDRVCLRAVDQLLRRARSQFPFPRRGFGGLPSREGCFRAGKWTQGRSDS